MTGKCANACVYIYGTYVHRYIGRQVYMYICIHVHTKREENICEIAYRYELMMSL